jgi:hypothetical protein
MTKIVPKYLYKYSYFDPNKFYDDLLNGKLFFPSPRSFNDPFDCMIVDRYDQCSNQELTQITKRLVIRENPYLTEIGINKLVKGNKKKWKRNNLTFENLEKRVKDYFYNKYGVFCLSEKYDDILMWGHYSIKHTGFCLRFNANEVNTILNNHFKVIKELVYLNKVDYLPSYPIINPANVSNEERLRKSLFTKFNSWSYEAEWRIVYRDGVNQKLEIPKNLISGIYLGLNTTANDEKTIQNIMPLINPRIEIFKAKKAKFDYRIEFDRIL